MNQDFGAIGANMGASSALPQGGFAPGGFWRRFVAAVVDSMILSVLGFVVTIPLGIIQGTADPNGTLFWVIYTFNSSFGLVISLIYNIWFYTRKGATPGKMLLSLKVVDANSGMFLSARQTIMRELVGKVLVNTFFTLCIGWIITAFMVGLRSDKRGLHDLVAGTIVLKSE